MSLGCLFFVVVLLHLLRPPVSTIYGHLTYAAIEIKFAINVNLITESTIESLAYKFVRVCL